MVANLFNNYTKIFIILSILLTNSCAKIKENIKFIKDNNQDLIVFNKAAKKNDKRRPPKGNISLINDTANHSLVDKKLATKPAQIKPDSKKLAAMPSTNNSKSNSIDNTHKSTYPKVNNIPNTPDQFKDLEKLKKQMQQDISELHQEIKSIETNLDKLQTQVIKDNKQNSINKSPVKVDNSVMSPNDKLNQISDQKKNQLQPSNNSDLLMLPTKKLEAINDDKPKISQPLNNQVDKINSSSLNQPNDKIKLMDSTIQPELKLPTAPAAENMSPSTSIDEIKINQSLNDQVDKTNSGLLNQPNNKIKPMDSTIQQELKLPTAPAAISKDAESNNELKLPPLPNLPTKN